MAPTKVRTIRIEDEVWDGWLAEAARRGVSVPALVREAMAAYLRPHPLSEAEAVLRARPPLETISENLQVPSKPVAKAPARKRGARCTERVNKGSYCKVCGSIHTYAPTETGK